jgi:ABC-2 type transport system permease protein
MRLRTIATLEARALLGHRTSVAALILYFAAGVAALAQGRATWQTQERVIECAAAVDAADDAHLQDLYANDEAGYAAYYLARSAVHRPSPWMAVAIGQRDLHAYVLRLRLLGLASQLYDAELGNPSLRIAGTFDLAFVLGLLGPLVLVALSYGVLAEDEETGRLRLVRAQGGSVPALLAVRLGIRAAAVAALSLGLLLLAVFAVPLPIDRRVLEAAGVITLHVALWAALVLLVVTIVRGSIATAVALLGVWLGTGVVGPAFANAALETFYPVPQGFELTLRQRMEVHGGWDRPRGEALERFAARRPQWRSAAQAAPRDRFSWIWYYANWEAADEAVAPLTQAYDRNLRARQALGARLATLFPPLRAGLLMSEIAGTDLTARLDFLERARAFHEGLKGHLYPLVIAGKPLDRTAYAALPTAADADAHAQGSPPRPLSAWALLPFPVAASCALGVARARLRRRLRAL